MLDLNSLIDNNDSDGKPLKILITDIYEDESQPRTEFPEFEMNQMAESIRNRGVISPISVHAHPTKSGKYIVNHGARRLRGSILAGKKTIRAFIDNNHNDYDQVMENKERLNHTPIEIAVFIKKKIDQGEKKKEIAKKLNEDAVYVTTHLALIDMPEIILKAYQAGCKSPKTIYDLRKLFEKEPEIVTAWVLSRLDKGNDIYRSDVQKLSKELKDTEQASVNASESVQSAKQDQVATLTEQASVNASESIQGAKQDQVATLTEQASVNASESVQDVRKSLFELPKMYVNYNSQQAIVLLTKKPNSNGHLWIELLESKQQIEVGCVLVEIESLVLE